LNSLEKQVLKTIGENTSDPDVFLDTDAGLDPIRDSLNDGIQELCMATGAYRIPYLLPLETNTWVYTLSWDRDYFGYIVQAWDRQRRYRLEQTDLNKLASMDSEFLQTTGNATHYVHIGYNKIIIYKKPSADGNVLELDCVAIPKPYVYDNSLVKMRANWERGVVYYAVSDFYASRGDANRATYYYNQYIEVANLMKLKPPVYEQQYRLGGQNGGT
jgi:hypothetical protein